MSRWYCILIQIPICLFLYSIFFFFHKRYIRKINKSQAKEIAEGIGKELERIGFKKINE